MESLDDGKSVAFVTALVLVAVCEFVASLHFFLFSLAEETMNSPTLAVLSGSVAVGELVSSSLTSFLLSSALI